MIDRLRQVLAGQGYDLGAHELLDVLWLARAVREGERRQAAAEEESRADAGPPGSDDGGTEPTAEGTAETGAEDGGTEGPDTARSEQETDGAEAAPGGDRATVLPSQRSLYAMGSEGGSARSRRA
ncbi:hypothetical protein GTY89_29525, partial [Streptomyces sp. SID5471]|nr:hypothetical protein [Streptomyces sp. SID5471]